jgi:hypothetical protein
MRSTFRLTTLLLAAALGCDSPMDPAICDTTVMAPLSTTPDFIGRVAMVRYEDGISPAGPLSQYELWLAISPASSPNAGLVVGRNVPVFVRSASGTLMPASACTIAMSDVVEVWHDQSVVYGSVEAPPSAPAYFGTQVVIRR